MLNFSPLTITRIRNSRETTGDLGDLFITAGNTPYMRFQAVLLSEDGTKHQLQWPLPAYISIHRARKMRDAFVDDVLAGRITSLQVLEAVRRRIFSLLAELAREDAEKQTVST